MTPLDIWMEARKLDANEQWDMVAKPYRIVRDVSSSAPGHYGWLQETICVATKKEAIEMMTIANSCFRTTGVTLDIVVIGPKGNWNFKKLCYFARSQRIPKWI